MHECTNYDNVIQWRKTSPFNNGLKYKRRKKMGPSLPVLCAELTQHCWLFFLLYFKQQVIDAPYTPDFRSLKDVVTWALRKIFRNKNRLLTPSGESFLQFLCVFSTPLEWFMSYHPLLGLFLRQRNLIC